MAKQEKFKAQGCPIRYISAVFGDKWSLMILRDLMFKERRYYGEFLSAGEGISTNILADRLQKLEQNGIVLKQTDTQNGTKQVYSLSQKGIALLPSMLEMMHWSATYDDQTEVAADFSNDLVHERLKLQDRITAQIRSFDQKLHVKAE